jgi:hypothetical protein
MEDFPMPVRSCKSTGFIPLSFKAVFSLLAVVSNNFTPFIKSDYIVLFFAIKFKRLNKKVKKDGFPS